MGDAEPKAKPPKRGRTSSPWLPRLRKRGEKLLHSKYVVILVIILTITDCSLVIAELILDLYSVKKTLAASEGQTFKFIRTVRTRYPDEFRTNDTVFSIFDRITQATILWNNLTDMDVQFSCPNMAAQTATSGDVGQGVLTTGSPLEFLSDPDRRHSSGTPSHVQLSHHVQHQRDTKHRPVRASPVEPEEDTQPTGGDMLLEHCRRLNRLTASVQHLRRNLLHETIEDQVMDEDTSRLLNFDDLVGYDSTKKTILILVSDLLRFHRHFWDYCSMHLGHPSLNSGKDLDLSSAPSNIRYHRRKRDTLATTSVDQHATSVHDDVAYFDVSTRDEILNPTVILPSRLGDDSLHIADILSSDTYSGPLYVQDAFPLGDATASGDQGGRQRRSSSLDDSEAYMRQQLHHSKEMEIAHLLHYASVGVVSVLVIEVTLKIVCAGSHFLKRKIEVFDAVVIVTSVVVDLIFIKGLSEFAVDDSIFVLALLLPWRVIRVVNSLVMAVIDHEHVKLRLLYSRKKKLDKTVENLRNELDELKGMIQDIRSFCIKEGLDASRIDGMLGKFAPRRRKDSKFYTLVKLVMSTASINNNDNESISSSSIENDLRHYSNRDSVLNETGSTDGTLASLRGFLSVPFSNGDSRSTSEIGSISGDQVTTSPSIYVTSPANDPEGSVFTFGDVELGDNEVFSYHDTSECIEEEESSVATMDVNSSSSNSANNNPVAFYLGSQTFRQSGLSQVTSSLNETPTRDNNDSTLGANSAIADPEVVSITSLDTIINLSSASPYYGKYLTVPSCTISASSVSTTISASTNNVAPDGSRTGDHNSPPPSPQAGPEMRRSVSDNFSSRSSPCEGVFSRIIHGSPVPVRRSSEMRSKRKSFTRYRSESDDNDSVGLIKRNSKGRLRRHSGDPHGGSGRTKDTDRARSHSPSPMTLLAVPGSPRTEGEDNCSSRSMNDVSSAGTAQVPVLETGGKILRRSCLSLNSEGRKKRGKSPHRVSFKVS